MISVADQLAWAALDDETKRIARVNLEEELFDRAEEAHRQWRDTRIETLQDEIETLTDLVRVYLNAKDDERPAAEKALAEAVQ